MATASASVARAVARCVLLVGLLPLAASGEEQQCPTGYQPTIGYQLPDRTITSGYQRFTRTDILKAGDPSGEQFIIGGGGEVEFIAGNCVKLLPDLRATAGSGATTFHAWVDPLPIIGHADPLIGPLPGGDGLTQTFKYTVSSAAGHEDVRTLELVIAAPQTATTWCHMIYVRDSNQLYVYNASRTAFSPAVLLETPNASSDSFNTNCTIDGEHSRFRGSGNEAELTLAITFRSVFAGKKDQSMNALNRAGLSSGWKLVGEWTVPNVQQYVLTTLVSPTGGGSVTPPCSAGCLYTANDWVALKSVANAGYQFTEYSGVNSQSGSVGSVQMTGNRTVTATFTPQTSGYTVTSVPAGLTVTVDGVPYTSPRTFTWLVGTRHTISAPASVDPGGGARYQFSNWSDGLAQSHEIFAPSFTTTYTANFAAQYYLTATTVPAAGGTISPASGWYAAGTSIPVTAAPASGYQFWGFTGAASGKTVPTTFDMNGPRSVTANFELAGTASNPDLTEMAKLSLFVKRHTFLVENGASPTNGGLYGLPNSDAAAVNAVVDSANRQLDQIQEQATSYPDGHAHMNARKTALETFKSQLQSGVSSVAWQVLDRFMNTALAPAISAVSLDGGTPPQPLAEESSRCVPIARNCLYWYSEINFFNEGGTNHGLGTYLTSWVEGPNMKNFTAQIDRPKVTFTPVGGSEPQVLKQHLSGWCDDCNVARGGPAYFPHTVGNPSRGTYRIEGFFKFQNTYTDTSGVTRTINYPPFESFTPPEQPPPPATRFMNPVNGWSMYQTPVDLKLTVAGAEMDSSGQTATIKACSGPVTVTAELVPPLPEGSKAPPIAWTGGSAATDNLHRIVACSTGTTTITAAVGTSLQAQITVRVNPPVIESFLPSQVQAGIERYMLTITGANLLGSGGLPTLSFGTSGVTYTIDSHSDSQVSGWIGTSNATPGEYTVRLTPSGSSQNATATIRVTAGAGRISAQYPRMRQGQAPFSDSIGIWWLGTAVIDSNDDCDETREIFPTGTAKCYWTWAILTAAAGTGGTQPSSAAPVVWTLTDPTTNLPSTTLTFTCRNTACTEIAMRPATAFYGVVNVQATIGDVPSQVFMVGIDYPDQVALIRTVDRTSVRVAYPAYESDNYLQLLSRGGRVIDHMPVHEEFPAGASWNSCGGSTGWTRAIPQTDPDPAFGWGAWVTGADGVFGSPDTVGYSCAQGLGCWPLSDIPGTEKTPVQPLSTQANAWSYLYFYVGSQDRAFLGKYLRVTPRKQVRYTDHGRDELQEWSCPQ